MNPIPPPRCALPIVTTAIALVLAAAPAAAQCLEPVQIITHPAGTSTGFAQSLDANSDWLVVGDPRDRVGAYLRGAAFMN